VYSSAYLTDKQRMNECQLNWKFISAFNQWLSKTALHHRWLAINQQVTLTGLWHALISIKCWLEIKKMADKRDMYLFTGFRVNALALRWEWYTARSQPFCSSLSYLLSYSGTSYAIPSLVTWQYCVHQRTWQPDHIIRISQYKLCHQF